MAQKIICDRCGEETKASIPVKLGSDVRPDFRAWDLCENCRDALVEWIEDPSYEN